MQAVLPFPEISPEIVSVTIFGLELALRWYALAYIVGILIGWRLVVMAVNRPRLWPHGEAPMTAEQVEELLTWVILGVIIGGRLGVRVLLQACLLPGKPARDPDDLAGRHGLPRRASGA